MISGSEQARVLKEFEEPYAMKRRVSESRYHHEELFFNQKEFKEQASGLV